MKRKPIFLAVALLFIVGAALWGVNYRLDHPPLSAADVEFRALVAGADRIHASQLGCPTVNCMYASVLEYKPLNAMQTQEITEQLRFVDTPVPLTTPFGSIQLQLDFWRGDKQLGSYTICQEAKSTFTPTIVISNLPNPYHHQIKFNPRFNKRLNRALDAYLPQRIRP